MSHYRGTKIYDEVRAALMLAAKDNGLTTYLELAELISSSPTRATYSELDKILTEIASYEVSEGRPMLCAVAVRTGRLRNGRRGKPRRPGAGFYSVGHHLGRLPSSDMNVEHWQRELESVYSEWR